MTYLLGLGYFASGILSLVVTYRHASLTSRRKVRVILAGTIAGFLPVFIWFAVALLFGNTHVGMLMYSWALPAAVAVMLLVPPAYAYAKRWAICRWFIPQEGLQRSYASLMSFASCV